MMWLGGRRRSQFPLDMFLWFKADTIVGVADGGDVHLWPDSSGHGYDTQNSFAIDANGPPTYHLDQVNGLPIVRTDTLHSMSIPVDTFPKQTGMDWTFFWLGNATTASSGNPIFIPEYNDPGEYSAHFYVYDDNDDTAPPYYSTHAWNDQGGGDPFSGVQWTPAASGIHVWAVRLSKTGPSAAAWKDGVAMTAHPFGTGGVYPAAGTVLGGLYLTFIPAAAPADTAEMLVYPRALTDGEVGAVNAYLLTRGGL